MHCTPHTAETKRKMSEARLGKPNIKKRRAHLIIGGIVHWQCSTCRQFLSREEFYENKKTVIGIKCQCKRCHCKTSSSSRDYHRSLDSNREFMARARIANPEKFRERDRLRKRDLDCPEIRARTILNKAVRSGKLSRPSTCSVCGGSGRIEGHHKDYSKPLEVVWLCSRCHGRKHRKVNP